LKIDQESHVISESNAANLYYSFEQMIAHHAVTGCTLKTGDLLGRGTISGPTTKSRGSLLEITEDGKKPLELHGSGGTISRTFLEDGDEAIITGRAGRPGAYVGFGECRGVVMPAWPL
jgi:fumarylacetoacetase